MSDADIEHSVECPICGGEFDPAVAGGWCTNPDCGEWQYTDDVTESAVDETQASTEEEVDYEDLLSDEEINDDAGTQGEGQGSESGFITQDGEEIETASADDVFEAINETPEQTDDDADQVGESPDQHISDDPGPDADVDASDGAPSASEQEIEMAMEEATDGESADATDAADAESTDVADTDAADAESTDVTDTESADVADTESIEATDAEAADEQDDPAVEEEEDAETLDCPACGTELSSEANFCIECGEDVTELDGGAGQQLSECPACDTDLSGDEKFCPGCGENLDGSRSTQPGESDTADPVETLKAQANDSEDSEPVPESLVLSVRGREIDVDDGDHVGREIRAALTDAGRPEDEAVRIHREHVRFVRESDSFYLVDLGDNPTKLNGQMLQKGDREPVGPGDELELSGVATIQILAP